VDIQYSRTRVQGSKKIILAGSPPAALKDAADCSTQPAARPGHGNQALRQQPSNPGIQSHLATEPQIDKVVVQKLVK